jgi:hypothetical protein
MQWYTHAAGQKEGPFSLDEVRAKIASGKLTSQTLVWKAGLPQWQRLTEVPELAALLANRNSNDLSVFTEMPAVAAEKTQVFDASALRTIRDEAAKAEKLERRSTRPTGKWVISVLVLASLGGVGYALSQKIHPTLRPIPDLDPTDYERLKSAAEAPENAGTRVEIARSKEDLAHPHFYIAGNLSDGARVDLTIKEIPGTALTPQASPLVIHAPEFAGHLSQTDKVTLSPGEYQIIMKDSADPARTYPPRQFFLGGTKDATYEATLKAKKEAAAKKKEMTETEQKEITQGITQLDAFQGMLDEYLKLIPAISSDPKVKKQAEDLQKKWDNAEKALPELSFFWRPQITPKDAVFGSVLAMARQTWDDFKAADNAIQNFVNPKNDRPQLESTLRDPVSKAKQSLILLKDEVAKPHPAETP